MSITFKKTVINNEIVYTNWFLRQAETVWDFIYKHILPVKTWYYLVLLKDRFKYAMERAFTGFDRRISWGYESSIKFYKRLLSDLYNNTHCWPGTAEKMKEICPLEWSEVEEKWKKKIPEGNTFEDIEFNGITSFSVEEENAAYYEYMEDGFQAWKKYIKRVLHYFEEADKETSSKKEYQEELYKKIKNPFDNKKERIVVEYNGEFFYQYSSLGNSKEGNGQKKISEELRKIDDYQLEQFKLGMTEIAKNIIYLND